MAKRSTRRMRGGFPGQSALCELLGIGCPKPELPVTTSNVTIKQTPAPNQAPIDVVVNKPSTNVAIPVRTNNSQSGAMAPTVAPGMLGVKPGENVAGGARRRRGSRKAKRTMKRKSSRRSASRKGARKCMYRKSRRATASRKH